MKATKKYKVQYDKAVGGVGEIVVKAQNDQEALKNAWFMRATGENFRNPVEVDFSTESAKGMGRNRAN